VNTILPFLRRLEKNNNREWFNEHKADYEVAKAEIIGFTEHLIAKCSSFSPELNGVKAKDCVFRIYRDTRFSKNKAPYKNNMGAYLSKGGKKSVFAGYYIHLQPGASFVAGGLWMPEPKELQLVRQEIYFRYAQLLQIVSKKTFKTLFAEIEGEKLKQIPKGFDKDHPAAAYLKMKSFIVSRSFDDNMVKEPDLLQEVLSTFKAMSPLVNFINEALDMKE
jgi:uncharacterized protein (TIGR02453 family)